jgi:hypothetical protein
MGHRNRGRERAQAAERRRPAEDTDRQPAGHDVTESRPVVQPEPIEIRQQTFRVHSGPRIDQDAASDDAQKAIARPERCTRCGALVFREFQMEP